MRACAGSSAYGMFPVTLEQPVFAMPEDRFADARRVRERYFSSGGGLLDMGVALTELGLVPFNATRAEVALARELDVMVTAHTGSVTSDSAAPRRSSFSTPRGCSTTARCMCIATPAPTTSWTCSPARARRSPLTPETELQMGMGFPIFARALERGLAPSLGCDIVSNNRGDLFAQMRLGLQAERARANQPTLDSLAMPEELRPRRARRPALCDARRRGGPRMEALVGSIEPGKAAEWSGADRGLHMAPLNDPVAAVVLHAGPADVTAWWGERS